MAERERVVYRLSDATKDVRAALIALGMTGEEYGALTPAMLEKGSWKSGSFRPYNIGVSPARTIPGRKNPYVEFLESVKDKLVSLGFEEFDGNMVETEFWNSAPFSCPCSFRAAILELSIDDPESAQYIENLIAPRRPPTRLRKYGKPAAGASVRPDFPREPYGEPGHGTIGEAIAKGKNPGIIFRLIARCFRYR